MLAAPNRRPQEEEWLQRSQPQHLFRRDREAAAEGSAAAEPHDLYYHPPQEPSLSLYGKRSLQDASNSSTSIPSNNSLGYRTTPLNYAYLSTGKAAGVLLASQIASLLSIAGSCVILYLVFLRQRLRRQKRYRLDHHHHHADRPNRSSSGGATGSSNPNHNSSRVVRVSEQSDPGDGSGADELALEPAANPVTTLEDRATSVPPSETQQSDSMTRTNGDGRLVNSSSIAGDRSEQTSSAAADNDHRLHSTSWSLANFFGRRRFTTTEPRQGPSSPPSMLDGETIATTTLYDRMVLGLVVTDLIATLAMLVVPYASNTGAFYSFGNFHTCAADAFFFQFCVGSFVYNAELSVYFLLTVRYGKKEPQIQRWLEPAAHILPFAISLAFGIAGLVTDSFNVSLLIGSCDFNPYPDNCVVVADTSVVDRPSPPLCQRGAHANMITQFQNAVICLSTVVGVVCTWLVYWTVRQQTLKMHRMFRQSLALARDDDPSSLPVLSQQELGDSTSTLQLQQQQQQQQHTVQTNTNDHSVRRRSMAAAFDIQQQLQLQRTRSVAMQCVCYTSVYLIGFIVGNFLAVMNSVYTASLVDSSELSDNPYIYLAAILVVFFYCLIGFLNCCIYIRPAVVQWKIADPAYTWSFAFRQVFKGRSPPNNATLAYVRRQRNATQARIVAQDGGGDMSSARTTVTTAPASSKRSENPSSVLSCSVVILEEKDDDTMNER